MRKHFLQYIILIFLLGSIFQASYVLYRLDAAVTQIEYTYTTSRASGEVNFCINTPPTVNLPCNATADQGETYTCDANASDPDGDALSYNTTFLTNQTLFTFNSSGTAEFKPNNSELGNHTFNLTVRDNSSCSNDATTVTFNLTVKDINDPPILEEELPDVSLSPDTTVRPFFLNNYFSDPDGDPLSFNVSGENEANVTILNSTSEVEVKSDTCGFTDVVFFTAEDPFNATNTSNPVQIECEESDTSTTSSSGSGGASGGGGGAGGLCQSNFDCSEYISCRPNGTKVKRCVDKNGCEEPERITVDCNYEESETCQEQWECDDWGACHMNDTQYRTCRDVNDCGTTENKPQTERSCDYQPTCDDQVMNGNETGIDCGGPCEPCQTVETPSPIEEETGQTSTALFGLITATLLGLIVFRWKRKAIYGAMATLGLRFSGRVPKRILLEEQRRDALLNRLEEIHDSEEFEELFDIVHDFYDEAVDVEVEQGREALLAATDGFNEQLREILITFYDKMVDLELSGDISHTRFTALLEECYELVLQVSETEREKLRDHQHDLEEAFPIERFFLDIADAYVALHFNDLASASEQYFDLLDRYEELLPAEQERVYADLRGLYQKIRYRRAWLENMGS